MRLQQQRQELLRLPPELPHLSRISGIWKRLSHVFWIQRRGFSSRSRFLLMFVTTPLSIGFVLWAIIVSYKVIQRSDIIQYSFGTLSVAPNQSQQLTQNPDSKRRNPDIHQPRGQRLWLYKLRVLSHPCSHIPTLILCDPRNRLACNQIQGYHDIHDINLCHPSNFGNYSHDFG